MTKVQSSNGFSKIAAFFIVLAIGIGAAGYLYYEASRKQIQQGRQDELLTIAALKVREISWWRHERMGDATVIASNPMLSYGIDWSLDVPPEHEWVREMLAWMRSIRHHYDYSDVSLLDVGGNVRLSLSGQTRIDDGVSQSLPAVMDSKTVFFLDLSKSQTAGDIRANLLVPILNWRAPVKSVIGIILLEIDPHEFLYPLIQSWPTPSPTSETLLVRREGDDVVFLNELRHRADQALSLRLPVADDDLPAAFAVRGVEGLVEGVDYRGLRVMAAVQRVPDSPWYLVAKVDEREVYAPIKALGRRVALVVAIMIAGAGIGISLLWTRHRAKLQEREQDALKRAHGELERRVAERTAELLESRERFRQIAEHIREVFYVADANLQQILYVSPAYEETWGRKRSSLYEDPKSWLEAVLPEDRVKVGRVMSEMGSSGHAIEYRIQRPDKSIRWIWDRGFSIRDESGAVYRYAGIAEDITTRKKAEEALQLDEARFKALFKLSQMAGRSTTEIVDFALEQQVELTRSEIGFLGFLNENETVLNIHAWSEVVMERCRVKEKVLHFPIAGAGLWADAVRKRRPIIINDYSAPNPGKKGYPEGHMALNRFMVVPIIEEKQIVIVAAVANKKEDYDDHDVRQFTLFLDGVWKLVQRKRAEKSLQQSERLASMGRALSAVAHDIKTPLIAIGGFSRLVKDHLGEDNPDREKLEIVIKETRRLENMVKDMLDFSMPLELHSTVEEIEHLITESMVIVGTPAKERGITLKKLLPHGSIQVSLDAMRMKQAIVNLAMNAIQASPEGETVTIKSYLNETDLVIEVIDRGPGIPQERREEVFASFQTSKKEGTGLGLAIVKKIIEAHHGQIRILDNVGKGLIMQIVIPASSQSNS